ncbi:MAG: hypothetical protein IPG71_12220 [bacterium]|nr:hypothetical protein [bacterium]
MSSAKQKKIYQVAKELNVASPAIVEFLEDRGYEVSKSPKHMSPMTEEMYDEVVKKFDPSRWQQMHEPTAPPSAEQLRSESERSRTDQLQELLETTSSQALDSAASLIKQVEAEEAKRAHEREEEEARERERQLVEERSARRTRIVCGAKRKRKPQSEPAVKRKRLKSAARKSKRSVQQMKCGVKRERMLRSSAPKAKASPKCAVIGDQLETRSLAHRVLAVHRVLEARRVLGHRVPVVRLRAHRAQAVRRRVRHDHLVRTELPQLPQQLMKHARPTQRSAERRARQILSA